MTPEHEGLVERSRRIGLCAELCRMGARSAVAADLLGLPRRLAIQVYREVTGAAGPPRGRTPQSLEWFFESHRRRAQASHLALFIDAARTALIPGERLLAAYRSYRALHPGSVIDINRAAALLEGLSRGGVMLGSCEACAARVISTGEPRVYGAECPFCRGEGGEHQTANARLPQAASA
ncbi:hypothetical protein J2T57_001308 [Natronocella acetinitrilica]|uniref:Flagellar transcriptional regulator FlhC n=1 Tax=Natronocella acetinitrilica TaxID=414046 RepID=A0AAE3G1W6_9GAMM|nr:FlhC family transcriptional regulator [Natronocella acetinitrilica]MCP1674206.1 hypothetical protein [Natronocella acetinitrilica]